MSDISTRARELAEEITKGATRTGQYAAGLLVELADELDRLKAGDCARDQRTTQFCAEAVAKDAEIRRLVATQAGPVVEWRPDGNSIVAQMGVFKLVVGKTYWSLLLFPVGAVSSQNVRFGSETGDAGKTACIRAYYRAIGVTTA